MFFAEKVRMFVSCAECGKRRVVYSKAKLNSKEMGMVSLVEEDLLYVCGNSLFPSSHPRHSEIVTREGINCQAFIETQYYSGEPF